jgi:hypothetical protein
MFRKTESKVANERVGEPTRAERGLGAHVSECVGESAGHSPSE